MDTQPSLHEAGRHHGLSLQTEKVTEPCPVRFYSFQGQQNQIQMPQPSIHGPVNAPNIGYHASQISARSICKLTVTSSFTEQGRTEDTRQTWVRDPEMHDSALTISPFTYWSTMLGSWLPLLTSFCTHKIPARLLPGRYLISWPYYFWTLTVWGLNQYFSIIFSLTQEYKLF